MSGRGGRTRRSRRTAALSGAFCATSAAALLACGVPGRLLRADAPRPHRGHYCAFCHDTQATAAWTVDDSGRPPLPRPPAGSDLEASLDEKDHKRLRYRVDKLCFQCHAHLDPQAEQNRGFWLHGPFKAGLCLGCHDPHEPDAYKLLVAYPWERLCVRCHDQFHDGQREKAFPGKCSDCHSPHFQKEAFPGAGEPG